MQDSSRKYKDTSSILQNNKLLDDWHWSEKHGAYLGTIHILRKHL